MDIHRPKPWHGWREFLKEYGIIVLGVLTALALEQTVEALRWAHEIGDAREVLGREISYDVKALKLIAAQDQCIDQRLTALQRWGDGAGARPQGTMRRPIYYTLQTSAWDVVNSGQVVAHFTIAEKMKFAQIYASLENERDTVAAERNGWQTLVSIAGDLPDLDDADRRDLRRAAALAHTIAQRRRGNALTVMQESPALAIDGPGPQYLQSVSDPDAFCRSLAAGAPNQKSANSP